MPPFPATMPSQRIDNQVRVENLLRNYISVNKQELNRLKGDLTAYRQEAQTAFNQKVAFPRPGIKFGDLPTEVPSETDVGPTGGGDLTETEQEAIKRQIEKLGKLPPRRPRQPPVFRNKSMKQLKEQLDSMGVPYPSNIKKDALHSLAREHGIQIEKDKSQQ